MCVCIPVSLKLFCVSESAIKRIKSDKEKERKKDEENEMSWSAHPRKRRRYESTRVYETGIPWNADNVWNALDQKLSPNFAIYMICCCMLSKGDPICCSL